MISIGDLTNLYKAFQSEQFDEEKRRREGQLNDAVELHIRNLFDDPLYPKRRRSFGIIRNRLPIFDGEPIELRRHLVRVGAHREKGDGEDELWHLPVKNTRKWTPKFSAISTTFIIIVIFISVLASLKDTACELIPILPLICADLSKPVVSKPVGQNQICGPFDLECGAN